MKNENYMRLVKRDETLTISDALAGDIPNLTREERQHPVKVELIRPIEVDGEKRDFLIVKPTTLKQVQPLAKGATDTKFLRLISECTGVPRKVLGTLLPSDFEKLKRLLLEFNRNHFQRMQN